MLDQTHWVCVHKERTCQKHFRTHLTEMLQAQSHDNFPRNLVAWSQQNTNRSTAVLSTYTQDFKVRLFPLVVFKMLCLFVKHLHIQVRSHALQPWSHMPYNHGHTCNITTGKNSQHISKNSKEIPISVYPTLYSIQEGIAYYFGNSSPCLLAFFLTAKLQDARKQIIFP